MTDNHLSSVSFSQGDTAKIIQNLDSNKTHGHDNISIRMLKICGSSIYKSLEMMFKLYIETVVFPKGNIVPIHKKGDKQTLKKLSSSVVVTYFRKILERLLFNQMFNFIENKLIS